MATSAIVKDGQIINSGTETESSKKSNSMVEKEQFLQLLVAQMKYQDPLEPMDNTEYVSQLATFSQLEQMQNISLTTEMQRATSMVGNLVTIDATNSATGVTTQITGKVDFVTMSGSKVKVSVNDNLYDLDSVSKVWDASYADAVALASEFKAAYEKLPNVNAINADNAADYYEQIKSMSKIYNAMSDYQKSFLTADIQNGVAKYVEVMKNYGYSFDS